MHDLWSALDTLGGGLAGQEAILAPARTPLTFAGLSERIAAIRDDLNRLGLGFGDRIAIASRGGPMPGLCLVSGLRRRRSDQPRVGRDEPGVIPADRPKAMSPAGLRSPIPRWSPARAGRRVIELQKRRVSAGTARSRSRASRHPAPIRANSEKRTSACFCCTSEPPRAPKIVPLRRGILALCAKHRPAIAYGRRTHDPSMPLVPTVPGSSLVSRPAHSWLFDAASRGLGVFVQVPDRYRPTVITALCLSPKRHPRRRRCASACPSGPRMRLIRRPGIRTASTPGPVREGLEMPPRGDGPRAVLHVGATPARKSRGSAMGTAKTQKPESAAARSSTRSLSSRMRAFRGTTRRRDHRAGRAAIDG